MKALVIVILFAGTHLVAKTQDFSLGELAVIKPSQVIIENYTAVQLSREVAGESMLNRFDVANPYTYLQIVHDGKGITCHIILQTNFVGKILFVGYSNNMSSLFNKPGKPMYLFNRCMKDINDNISSVQVIAAALKCIIARLNYCSEY